MPYLWLGTSLASYFWPLKHKVGNGKKSRKARKAGKCKYKAINDFVDKLEEERVSYHFFALCRRNLKLRTPRLDDIVCESIDHFYTPCQVGLNTNIQVALEWPQRIKESIRHSFVCVIEGLRKRYLGQRRRQCPDLHTETYLAN